MGKNRKIIGATARMAVTAGLAAAVALGGVAPALAAEAQPNGYSITVNKATEGTYVAYRLSTGKFTESDGKLVMNDIAMNADYQDDLVAVLTDAGFAPDLSGTDRQDAFAISDKIAEAEAAGKAQAVANKLAAALAGKQATDEAAAKDGKVSLEGLQQGYYLVASKTGDEAFSKDGNAMTSAMLVKVSGDVSADAKVSKPTLDKRVRDAAQGRWDSAGGHVADAGLAAGKLASSTYTLTGTLPSNIADYDTYKYTFTDVLPAGVTTDEGDLAGWGVKVSATSKAVTDAVDLTGAFKTTVQTDDNARVSTLTWSADDLKGALEAAGITGDDLKTAKVTVEYTPVLDQADLDALYAAAGTLARPQVNTAKITFSNNPYVGGSGTTSVTPEHETRLYSYNLKVSKVDEAAKALPGAKFTLTAADGKVLGRDITAADDGTFQFTGLEADVEYTLTETAVPAGKRSIEPIKFTIAATVSPEGDAVTAIAPTETADPSNAATLTASDATVEATVVNVTGPNLPVTGQAGIAAGVALGAVVITVSVAAKRRADAREERRA